MNELKLPQLWFAKRHIPSGRVFKDPITHRFVPDWDKTPISMLHSVAIKRIAEMNTKMPNEWEYALLGWELDNTKEDQP